MTDIDARLSLAPDRLLPVEPSTRAIARRIYDQARTLPLLSPHGHVDPALLLHDEHFADPAELFVTPDHYVTRLLHADGVALESLGVGKGMLSEMESRQVWRHLCERWHVFRGTPVRGWLEAELAEIFDVDLRPSARTADVIYDQVATRLQEEAYRPRALYKRFGLAALATTDDPCSSLSVHAALAADPSWHGRVVPTFRPDRYLEMAQPGWTESLTRLAEAADVDTGEYRGFLRALEQRRRYFVAHGATSADHSHLDAGTEPLEPTEAARIFRAGMAGEVTTQEALAFRRHMLMEMAAMSCEDGLVMTLHPGVMRNHHRPSFEQFGADVGHDIPLRIELTVSLRPLLERFGTFPGFHLVVFTVDESVWSRELAPLAGFYPSLYIGVPWWFLDAPDAIRRFHAAVVETTGFSRLSGFVDDTRTFCSIPARHDMARRLDAGTLGRLVVEGRLDEDEAVTTARELISTQPTSVFKL